MGYNREIELKEKLNSFLVNKLKIPEERRKENIITKLTLVSIITSTTTLLALLSIYFFGGEILKGFSLAMILGVIFGTYSSIFIANPVLVFLKVSQKTILKEDKN